MFEFHIGCNISEAWVGVDLGAGNTVHDVKCVRIFQVLESCVENRQLNLYVSLLFPDSISEPNLKRLAMRRCRARWPMFPSDSATIFVLIFHPTNIKMKKHMQTTIKQPSAQTKKCVIFFVDNTFYVHVSYIQFMFSWSQAHVASRWNGTAWQPQWTLSGLGGSEWNRRPAAPNTMWRLLYLSRKDEVGQTVHQEVCF